MIDTHAHLNFEAFNNDWKEVVENSFKRGIKGIINVGTRFDNSKKAIKIAEEFKNIWAAIGFHPDHLDEIKIEDIAEEVEKFKELAKHSKVVAIGEVGLDNYYFKSGKLSDTKENKKKAQKIFEIFLNLAQKLNLPVIIHSREAERETYNILNSKFKVQKSKLRGVVHCFSGSIEFAKKISDLGFYLGFTGIITYPNAKNLQKVVENVPLEKILIETDCPYLAPQSRRGKRCEPWDVLEIAQKIAKIKDISFEEVVQKTTKNARILFNLKT